MAIAFFLNHFTDRADAVAQLQASGLHSIDGEIKPADLTGAAHVHPYDVEIYMLGGVFELTDAAAGKTHRLEAGGKAVVPANTMHAEFSPAGFSAVFGVSVDPSQMLMERARVAPGD